MPLGTRKRRDDVGASGNGDDHRVALLGGLGLGSYLQLDLPVLPDGLDLAANVDIASNRVTITLGGHCITASPVDLALALALPLGTVALAPKVNADVFSFPEAIAVMRGFVHDRLLKGSGGGGRAFSFPKEAIVALQLVEEGKAYEVDWGGLVWALLKRAVLVGNPWIYSHHLHRLIKCQKPELFCEVDGMILLGRISKCLPLQQPGRTDQQLVNFSEAELENWLNGNINIDQPFAAEPSRVEELTFGVSQNIEETMILGDNSYYQRQGEVEEMDARLISLTCQPIGKSEEMPAFGYETTQQHVIATKDQEGGDNVNAGHSNHVITNLSSFHTCMEEILACARAIDNALLNKDKDLNDTQAEIQRLMAEKEEKDNLINSILQSTMKDLQAWDKISKILNHEKMTMISTLQQLGQKLKETNAAFNEYKNNISAESGVSSLDGIGMYHVGPTLPAAHQVQGSSRGAGLR